MLIISTGGFLLRAIFRLILSDVDRDDGDDVCFVYEYFWGKRKGLN